MNVSRRTVRGVINPYEKHQTQFYITSAGTKASWAYEKNIEIFERSIINPQDYWSFGCDYRIPIMHGLLDKSYIDDIKTSATFDEASFARELTFPQLSINFLNCWKTLLRALYTTAKLETINAIV